MKKTEADYSPTTMYAGYPVSPTLSSTLRDATELRPRPRIESVGPGPTRADLLAALIHQPTKGEINDVAHL